MRQIRELFDNPVAEPDEKADALKVPVDLIKAAATAVHQFDNPPEGIAAPEGLLSAQSDADASQLAAVASIEAAAQSVLQVTLAAEANSLVADQNSLVATAAATSTRDLENDIENAAENAKQLAKDVEHSRIDAALEDLSSAQSAAKIGLWKSSTTQGSRPG